MSFDIPALHLGKVIKDRREAVGLSQEEFAERSELHRTYVSQLERGLKSPSVRVLSKMASALGCKAWELLREAENYRRGLS